MSKRTYLYIITIIIIIIIIVVVVVSVAIIWTNEQRLDQNQVDPSWLSRCCCCKLYMTLVDVWMDVSVSVYVHINMTAISFCITLCVYQIKVAWNIWDDKNPLFHLLRTICVCVYAASTMIVVQHFPPAAYSALPKMLHIHEIICF